VHLTPRMVRLANFVTGRKMTAGAIAVWVDDGEVLLVRSKHGERRWGFPGGVLGKHEHPVDGACRELAEETGLSCTPADLRIVGVHVQESGRHLDCVYRVLSPRPATGSPLRSGDAFEIAEVGWWSVTALPALRHEAVRAIELYPDLLG
jgi:ADP-ribose pyrophosphatase YjhB (NUDIX family)